jgi:hypothetical protein
MVSGLSPDRIAPSPRGDRQSTISIAITSKATTRPIALAFCDALREEIFWFDNM